MSLKELCNELALNKYQCEVIQGFIAEQCNAQREEKVRRKSRARSKWQECIAIRRKGQKFDPEAIKKLAKEYKEGKCP